MNARKHTWILLAALLAILALAACGEPGPTPAPTPAPTPTAVPTLAALTEAPTAAPTAAPTDAPTAAPAAAPPPTEELATLRANPWQWISFTSPMEQFEIATPLSYLVQFKPDATLNVVADCNNAAGAYQGEGGKLQIELGPMTAAACPPDSRSDQFVRLLSGAALYFFQDGNLHIDLFADSGTMVFSPAPPDIFGDDGEGAVAGLPEGLVATLGNLSYSGLFDDRAITLAGGAFTETSDAEPIAVRLLDPFVAAGDLNGDGSEDAVALLELDTSGTGRFTYLAPVLDILTTPAVGPAIMVEDRIQPTALTIADGQVVFEYIGHGEGDGECCPSWNIRHTFAWQDSALVEVSRAEVSKAEAAAPASSLVRTDAWTPVACDTLGVAPELATVAECGYVTVPENRAAGTDKTIQLAAVRVPSTADNPGAPVILGTGGPGGAGLQGATAPGGGSTFLQTHAAILADRDWVFFTQRGSPQAKPELSCPAYNNVPLEAAKNGWSAEEKLARATEAMQACLDDFAAQGVDLTAYTSVENAADIDALRQALGYDKIIYYGESYGTLLGQYLLRAHPEIVESIILDGIAPATAVRWTDVTKINESFERVFDACAADEACHAVYPDPAGALTQALADLKANPAPFTLAAGEGITVPLQVNDVLAMNALFINLYVPGGYAQVPAIVYQLSQGDTSVLASTIPLYYANSGNARVMHLAIACSDDPVPSLDEVDLDVPEMYQGLIIDDAMSYITECPLLDVPHMDDTSDALVESETPALLLQGGLDPATPVSGGDNVATGLPNSYNIVVPAGSHIQSHSPCILDIMAAFMRDPQAAPDTSCIDQTVAFRTPGAVSYAGPGASNAISITLPAIFGSLGQGQWSNGATGVVIASFPPTKTVEAVLGETAAALQAQESEMIAGPTIAGMESMFFQTPTYDTYVFGDAQGTYRIAFFAVDPNSLDFARATLYPELLDSVTVGPAPAAAAEPSAEAAGATAMDAISEEDLALFQQAAQESFQRMVARNQEACPDASSRTFPLAEPDYNAKRPLDLSAFADALAAFDPARAEEIDVLLAGKSIPDIQALLDGGELTSVELVTYYLDRIQRYDVERLNSVIELNPQVLADAAAADAARSAGAGAGALHGIPVLLKDNIATSGGLHTTAGVYALKDWQPARDAFLVQQLRNAGALVLGKANLSEWANYMDPCMPSGFSAVGGQTRNPYGPYETYGSSSGSGVAVGANFATVAVGSETSGSMIQPARVNSVVGLRPSQGLISRDHVVPLGPHLDTPGPMGRSVTDVAILLNALKGADENDPKTADAAALADVDFTQYLSLDEARKVRVGVIMPNKQVGDLLAVYRPALEASLGRAPTDAELQEIAETMLLPLFGFNQPAALDALKVQGIEVVAIDDATLPWTDKDTAQPQLPYDFNAGVAALFGQMEGAPITSLADVIAINNEDPANRAPYGQSYVEWSANNTLTAEEFARVQATAAALANTWMDTVLQQNDVDILVTGMLYSGNAGAAGVPALTIPNGLDANGRPQGIILSGPYLSDPQLIAVGYALEQALNGRVEPDLDATIAQIDAVTGK